MTVPRDGDPICPTGAVRLVGRRGVMNRCYVGCSWSGTGHCTWCDARITERGRSTWCSQWCVDAFNATQPERQRDAVEARDGGVCALCELDTGRFRRAVLRWWALLEPQHRGDHWPEAQRFNPWQHAVDLLTLRGRTTSGPQLHLLLRIRKRWWDMDHTVPISEGGHPYDMRNLRTLCYWCHSRVSSEAAARRADQRKRLKAHDSGQQGLFGDPVPKS